MSLHTSAAGSTMNSQPALLNQKRSTADTKTTHLKPGKDVKKFGIQQKEEKKAISGEDDDDDGETKNEDSKMKEENEEETASKPKLKMGGAGPGKGISGLKKGGLSGLGKKKF